MMLYITLLVIDMQLIVGYVYVVLCSRRATVDCGRSTIRRGVFLGLYWREAKVNVSCYWQTCTRVSCLDC